MAQKVNEFGEVIEEESKIKKAKPTVLIVVAVILGIVLLGGVIAGTVIFTLSKTKVSREISSSEATNSEITTYTYEHEVLDGKEREEAATNLHKRLETLKLSNICIQTQTGEDQYETYIYNKNDEAFAQVSDASYTVVFRNDGKAIKYSSAEQALAIGSDIDILSISDNVAKAAMDEKNMNNENVNMFYMIPADEMTAEDKKLKEYRIELKGKDAVKLMYSSIDDEFAENMVNSLTDQSVGWTPHIIMVYLVNEETNEINIYCYYVADGKEYTNWAVLGMATIDNWELNQDWYGDIQTYDEEKLQDLFQSTLSGLEELVADVMEDDMEESEQSEEEVKSSDEEIKQEE